MGYFAQQALDLLDPDLTIEEQLQRDFPDESIGVLRNLAGAFQFSGDDIDKKVRSLSGGEKTRLVIARMLLNPPNFLVLDEPTNHLDLFTKEMLIEALKDFEGTMLFVSHDRAFLRASATASSSWAERAASRRSRISIRGRTSNTSRAPGTKRRACIRRPGSGIGIRDSGFGIRDSRIRRPGSADYRVFAIARTPPSENWAMCCAIRSSSRSVMVFGRSAATGWESSARHCA